MAKTRSQRRSNRHLHRAQAGCIWGLISIFDFRHGRSTRRLLSDRKQAVGSGCSSAQKPLLGWTEKCEHILDSDEIKMLMADAAKTSVKDLMGVEMFNKQSSMDQPTDSKSHSEQISSKCSNKTSGDLDLERIMEELSKIITTDVENCRKTDVHGLNKCVFLKLLQDPNSALVKHIRNFEDAQVGKYQICLPLPGPNVLEEKLVSSGSGEFSGRRHRSFFHRRSKSLGNYSLGRDKDSQSPHIVQKPGLAGAQSPDIAISNCPMQSPCISNNDKNTSHFSFTEIKRKLKHAMGKERLGVSPDRMILKLPPKHQSSINGNRSATGETLSWSSPNRNHFFSERFNISSPKSEHIGKVEEKDSVVQNGTSRHPQLGESNIYIEAKKHLSEMLERVELNAEPMATRMPKSLGRILSFPECKFSPCSSPRKYDDGTTQTRLSLHGTAMRNEKNLDGQSCISGLMSEENVQQPHEMNVLNSPLRDDLECPTEVQSFTRCPSVPQAAETEEVMESKSQQEETIVDVSSESCRTSLGEGPEKGGSRGVESEVRASEFLQESSTCSKSDLCEEDEILSSSMVSPLHPPVSLEVKDPVDENGKEHPSPISILEPLFSDDDISPASSTSGPVEKEIQHFEEQPSSNDQEICMGICVEGEETEFEYVEAVLLGSGLSWDEFVVRWVSLDEILDSSLFDEVELFSSRPRYDQKLLFDCANESLKEVCNNYFGWFRVRRQGKSNMGAIPSGMDLIHEIWKGVEGHLYERWPHSLEQLVRMDLDASRKWMHLYSDMEVTCVDMEEAIFSEFLDELVRSFVNDISSRDH